MAKPKFPVKHYSLKSLTYFLWIENLVYTSECFDYGKPECADYTENFCHALWNQFPVRQQWILEWNHQD